MDRRPIGVFDSGLGGLTAVRELSRLLPGEEIIYVDGLEGLDALMSGISAIHLYTGR